MIWYMISYRDMIWYEMISYGIVIVSYHVSYHMGVSCLGYELSWVRVGLSTSCPGYELSWVRVVLTSCLGYELSWVRVVQIPMAASSGRSLSFDQNISTWFAGAAATPAAVAAAAVTVPHICLEGRLDLASNSYIPELPVADSRQELVFLYTGDMCRKFAHYHDVLFDVLLLRDNFYIAYCAAETLVVEYVVKLGLMVVCDKMQVSLLKPGVANVLQLCPS